MNELLAYWNKQPPLHEIAAAWVGLDTETKPEPKQTDMTEEQLKLVARMLNGGG